MKIGINALSITPDSTGGATTYIVELTRHLSRIDCRNNYVLFIRSDSRHHFCSSESDCSQYGSNFKFVAMPMPPIFSIVFRVLVDQLIMSLLAWWYRLDVLFCPGDTIPLWTPCASVMVIQNLIYFHSGEVYPLGNIKKRKFHTRAQLWYYKRFALRSALKSDRLITVSENAKREIVGFLKVNHSKISVIHHGVSPQFRGDSNSQDSAKNMELNHELRSNYILYVGAILPYKNIETVIEALSIIKARNSITDRKQPLSLVIAGADYSGYEAHVRAIAEKSGVLDQVMFLGYVPYEQLPALYYGAKVFVLLSLCESFGLPILEAMACGCPVVCSNVSSLPEIAGDAAILVDPKDPIEAADAIEAILKDEEHKRRLISMGNIRIREFSWNRAASQTLSVLQQSVKDRSGGI